MKSESVADIAPEQAADIIGIRTLRDAGVPVAGGFDARVERDCLDLLLRG